MRNEAIERMKLLKMLPDTIRLFKKGTVLKSTYGGILFELNDEQKELVEKFEQEYNCLVYHCIECNYKMSNGDIMSAFDMLYVGSDKEEWSDGKQFIKDEGYVYVNTISNFVPYGEIGSVLVKMVNDGLMRR